MRRTSPVSLLVAALVGAALGFGVDAVLVGGGRPILPMPPTVGVVLATIGAVLLALAWPVRRMVRGGRRVGFRHALATLALAKASALVAAVAGGWALGALAFVASRPVVSEQAVAMSLVAVGGGIVLLVAALVAESWCALPPDDDAASPA